MDVPELSVTELAVLLGTSRSPLVLDVREPWELEIAPFETAVHMPMNEVPERITELQEHTDDGQTIAVLCRSGARSRQVAVFLKRAGLHSVVNVAGGIIAWSEQVDPEMPTY